MSKKGSQNHTSSRAIERAFVNSLAGGGEGEKKEGGRSRAVQGRKEKEKPRPRAGSKLALMHSVYSNRRGGGTA